MIHLHNFLAATWTGIGLTEHQAACYLCVKQYHLVVSSVVLYVLFFVASSKYCLISRGEPWCGMNHPTADDTFAQFFERASLHSPGAASMHSSQRPHKAAPIEHQLACNLADLYKGTTKKMKISRELSDSSGQVTTVMWIYNYFYT